MNEQLIITSFDLVVPTNAGPAVDVYFEALCDMTVVGMVVAMVGSATDADANVDLYDDGSAVIEDTDGDDTDVPGTWQAKGYGGTNDPVVIAKSSLVSLRPTDNANGNAFVVTLYWLAGQDWRTS
jgi:hypothetical protein